MQVRYCERRERRGEARRRGEDRDAGEYLECLGREGANYINSEEEISLESGRKF